MNEGVFLLTPDRSGLGLLLDSEMTENSLVRT